MMSRFIHSANNNLTQTLCWILLVFFPLSLWAEDALQITHVVADRTVFHSGDSPVAINFSLNQPASVRLTIYDARNIAVRTIASPARLSAGHHVLQWDGKDERQRPVPAEVYFYTLTALGESGGEVIYDLTDKTGGEPVILQDVRYDSKTETVQYAVPETSRVFLRAGIPNAFIFKTLINGGIREKGVYQESWDGRDDNNVMNVKAHANYALYGQGYRLSTNAIIVQSKQQLPFKPEWIGDIDQSAQRAVAPKPRGLHRYAYQPVDQARDVELTLHFPKHSRRTKSGAIVANQAMPITVDLPLADALALEAQRVEVMFYLDNQMLYENEASYFPYTWTWDPTQFPPGEHFLTGFVFGLGGFYGVSIHKVLIEKPQ